MAHAACRWRRRRGPRRPRPPNALGWTQRCAPSPFLPLCPAFRRECAGKTFPKLSAIALTRHDMGQVGGCLPMRPRVCSPRDSRGRSPPYWHLCGGIERTPEGTRGNMPVWKSWRGGAAAATRVWCHVILLESRQAPYFVPGSPHVVCYRRRQGCGRTCFAPSC